MTTHKIKKSKFSQLNDERFYFPNAIISLPFGHISLQVIGEYKKNKGRKTEKFLDRKRTPFRIEKKCTQKQSENKLFK